MTQVKNPPIITDEIATVLNDITQTYVGKILINPDKVLSTKARGEGLELYEDLERDAHLYSVMQTRKLAVTAKEWRVDPASEKAADVEIARFVEEVFREAAFDRACLEQLDGIMKGFKPSEIMWDYSEGDLWIKEFKGRDPARFTFGVDGRLRLLTWSNMIEGEELPQRKFQVFRFGQKNDSPFGMGLGQKCYWPVWFKKNGVKFWVIFAEKFGMPTVWGKYPPGTPKEKQDELLSACRAIQTDTAIKTPDNMLIELIEGKTIHEAFLKEKGEGLHHIGFEVKDLKEGIAKAGKLGLQVTQSWQREDGLGFAYLDSDRTGGVVFEMIQWTAAGKDAVQSLKKS